MTADPLAFLDPGPRRATGPARCHFPDGRIVTTTCPKRIEDARAAGAVIVIRNRAATQEHAA